MKKSLIQGLVIAMVLCLVGCPALAAGKMVVSQENFHIIDSYSVYGYGFAKVENTGDKPVEFSAGLFEIYDENGDTLTSTDYVKCYPECLQLGEVGYVYVLDEIDAATTHKDVDDYMLTVTGKSTNSTVVRYPATGSYQTDVQISKYSRYNYVVAEITNDTDETVFNMEVVIALLDDEENILYVTHNDFHSDTGINAGSTITYRDSLSDSFYDAWKREGVTPTHVEVIAYREISNY